MIEILRKYNVRVIITDTDEWFNADDIGKVLDLENIRYNIRKIKEKYKIRFNNSNVSIAYIRNFEEVLPNRGTTFIKAQAVYQIAFRSNKPDAMEFTEWVSEIIELIRKNGYYIADEKSEQWLGVRSESKKVRRSFTDEIQEFVYYATSKGSNKPTMYYKHFTKLINNKLEIPKELKRDDLNQDILMDIMALERVISMKLPKLINENTDYKEIYKIIKELINNI